MMTIHRSLQARSRLDMLLPCPETGNAQGWSTDTWAQHIQSGRLPIPSRKVISSSAEKSKRGQTCLDLIYIPSTDLCNFRPHDVHEND
jgi:hypothetical protein